MFKDKKGMAGAMGVLIYTIISVAVTIPVTQDVIDNANLTGTTATVVGLIPLFVGLGTMFATARASGLL